MGRGTSPLHAMKPHLRRILAPLALGLLVPAAAAQCRTLAPSFAAAPGPLYGAAVADFGGGPELFVLDRSQGPAPAQNFGRVLRWTGAGWEEWFRTTQSPGVTPLYISQLIAGTDTGGSMMALVEVHSIAGLNPPGRVWRFDGSTWTAIGDFTGLPEIALVDEGSGPQLVAFGEFFQVSGAPIDDLARWNGSAWSGYGAGPGSATRSVAMFDSGGGPQLHAGTVLNGVTRWNGSSWSTLGPVLVGSPTDLEVLDAGLGPRLYATMNSSPTNAALLRWDGVTWQPLFGLPARVDNATVVDLGGGPRLYLAGQTGASNAFQINSFDGTSYALIGAVSGTARVLEPWPTPGGPRLLAAGALSAVDGLGMRGLASWDGAAWSYLGGPCPDGRVAALCAHDFGSGPQLVVGGEFLRPQGHPSMPRAARWTGAGFADLGNSMPSGLYALCSADVAGTPTLFAAGDLNGQVGSDFDGLARWNGTGWQQVGSGLGAGLGSVGLALIGHDDGSGPALFVGGQFTVGGGGPGERIARWNGTSWWPLQSGVNDYVNALARYDEGAGAKLFAAGEFTSASGVGAARIARWNGSGWSALGAGLDAPVLTLCTFDDGAGEQLYAGGTFTSAGGTPVQYLARWNGTSWSDVPGGGSNGVILSLCVHDDGRGPALYVGGGFGTIGGITAYNLARFDGSGWEAVGSGFDNAVRALASFDDDGDGDAELFIGGDFQNTATASYSYFARLEGCPHHEAFCSGDGLLADHTTPCPCGNIGLTGRGCANPFDPNGALMEASGSTSADTLVLACSGTPLTAFGVYMQHDALDDRVFHDGVLCAGGNLIRLRNRSAVLGESTFPNSTDTQTLSQRGQVTPGSGATRYYALFYRSASPTFCPPATANVTNGIRVVW